MFSHYVIEADDRQAGLVILERGGFRFYAANPAFSGIEGRLFRSALEATRAAESLVGRGARRRATPRAASPLYTPVDGRVASSLIL
jgi:hypothetical protein